MDKKKKIIIISVCVLIAINIIGVAIYFTVKNVSTSSDENKLAKIYERMMQNETYSFSLTLDDNNKTVISRKGNMANVDIYSDGNHTTNIVRDGNTILLMYNTQKYYTYQNNEIQLTELSNELDRIIQSEEPQKGEEEIDGKNYKYEEYQGVSYFLVNQDITASRDSTTTRFYFKGDNLKYIKTIMGEESELIQVDVSYNVDDDIFEIPENFEEG